LEVHAQHGQKPSAGEAPSTLPVIVHPAPGVLKNLDQMKQGAGGPKSAD
jgi:hypothetical protein